jgi:hypothetical protein
MTTVQNQHNCLAMSGGYEASRAGAREVGVFFEDSILSGTDRRPPSEVTA